MRLDDKSENQQMSATICRTRHSFLPCFKRQVQYIRAVGVGASCVYLDLERKEISAAIHFAHERRID